MLLSIWVLDFRFFTDLQVLLFVARSFAKQCSKLSYLSTIIICISENKFGNSNPDM
jgi:hypothetical protein